jgi:hypothetical protein
VSPWRSGLTVTPLLNSLRMLQGCLRGMARRIILEGHLFKMARPGH